MTTDMNHLTTAQKDMRSGYADGAPGIITSGAVWITAAMVTLNSSPKQGIWTLIIGGMFIFPLSMLLSKLLGVPGKHHQQNALAKLAMEGTIWMIMCIPLAYGLSLQRSEWFFQGMLLIIGGRYLTFASVYGMRTYWILGALLGLVSMGLFMTRSGPVPSAFAGGIIELVFGIFMFFQFKRSRD
jgi:hypothetical protein